MEGVGLMFVFFGLIVVSDSLNNIAKALMTRNGEKEDEENDINISGDKNVDLDIITE